LTAQPKTLERLRHNILFEDVGDDVFEAIRPKLIERRFQANDVVLEDEGVGESLYLIVDGRVKIIKRTKYGDEILIALLHHGDCFGELELIDGRPRASRVIAVENCVVYEMKKTDFEQLVRESSPFGVRLLQLLSIRLRALNFHFAQELHRSAERSITELQKLQRLIEAAEVVNSTLELDKLLTVILEIALRIVEGDRGTLYLIDEQKQELWSKILKGDALVEIRLPLGKGIAGYVGATGDILNIPDAYLDHRFNPEFDERSGYRTRTILCMPMRNKDQKIIGVIQLLNKRNGQFTTEDENFINALSIQSSIAIENARLYEQERQKIAMEKDLFAAREVQMSLLPKSAPTIDHYDVAGITIPAQLVGGDYFDFIPVAPGRIALCVGDVSGKGLAASLLMVSLQATLRGLVERVTTPREWIEQCNRLMYYNTAPDKFVTLFFAQLDYQQHVFSFCNAGHNPALLFSGECEHRALMTGGTVLSIVENFTFEDETVPLLPGDTVVMYSDGITETVNQAGEQFGDHRLIEVLSKVRTQSSKSIIEAVMQSVNVFASGAAQADDRTILVLKRV
jgi:sigma-B regulation protein RsbU (phosphoserine phosphatase)